MFSSPFVDWQCEVPVIVDTIRAVWHFDKRYGILHIVPLIQKLKCLVVPRQQGEVSGED